MTQNRVYDFGALLTQGRANTAGQFLFSPGVYSGFVPSIVSATTVEFSPGVLLLPNGVVIQETSPVQVTIPTPGTAENYTITAEHSDLQSIGGSSVSYVLGSATAGPNSDGIALRSSDPNANSLALLWIRHSGGGGLTASMLSRPPSLTAGVASGSPAFQILPAPFPQKCSVVSGSNITATQSAHSSGNQHLGLLVQYSAVSGLQTHQFRLPVDTSTNPKRIEVFADIPALGSISVAVTGYEVYLDTGSVLGVDIAQISGAVNSIDFNGSPAGTFVLDPYDASSTKIASIGVTITVPPSTSGFFLKGLKLIGD